MRTCSSCATRKARPEETHFDVKEQLKADEVIVTCRKCKSEVYKRARTASSNLFSVGIFGNHLIVEFLNGYPLVPSLAVYLYPDRAHQLNKLLKAQSIGEYFADNIKAEAGSDFIQLR